jgi:VanZ family protein
MARLSTRHRSSATGLALVFTALIVYASLYPFKGWHWPAGAAWHEVLALPMPKWRIAFDMGSNFLGYLPLGFLMYVAGVRSGWRPWGGWWFAVLLPAGLSYSMEVTQQFLPGRYPSLLDWTLNAAGALAGAVLGVLVQALSLIDHWQATRDRWFIRHSAGALTLLLLWPVGLLFPSPIPLGLGVGWERLQDPLVGLLLDVSWAQGLLEAVSDVPLPSGQPVAVVEAAGVTLGLLAPCLLAYSVMRPGWRRLLLALAAAGVGLGAATLSAAMNFGPAHALAWITPEVMPAMAMALVVCVPLVLAGQRLSAALAVVCLSALIVLVLQAPADPYFAESLQAWQQGEFIHFYGLAQWIGWLWPYAALVWLTGHLARKA